MKKRENLCNYIILLNKKDNVGTAIHDIPVGRYFYDYHENKTIINIEEIIKAAFKVSLCKIKKGERIIKYGNVIGIAKTEIDPGEKVHTENIKSLIENEKFIG